jgi:CTP synthase
VIALMAEQKAIRGLGGTMRLGSFPCALEPGSLAREAYASAQADERHRHRYEFNNAYRELFESKGMAFSGQSPDGALVEIAELKGHPWYLGCQFHPEFQSGPMNPHPLFVGFVRAARDRMARAKAAAAELAANG